MEKHFGLRVLLTGDSLNKIIAKKRTTRYRVAKETGVSYMMLYNWAKKRTVPQEKELLIVARYLGLIKDKGPKTKIQEKGGKNG